MIPIIIVAVLFFFVPAASMGACGASLVASSRSNTAGDAGAGVFAILVACAWAAVGVYLIYVTRK